MAEIKSTIDLIMERTKNLSASKEEREAWHRQEREKHIRGLIQRLLDYSLSLDDVKDELAREKEKAPVADVMACVGKALAGHVDPEADNERLFRIINELAGTPEGRLREELLSCGSEFAAARSGVAGRQIEDLRSEGISGSAVLPNPEADAKWKARREEMLAACAKRFLGIIHS